MSVFRWRYTEECEGRYCCGDCDKCDKEDEPVDDLISRQAAIDAVIKHLQLDYEYAWGVREAINGLPTADLSEYSDKLWETAYERGKAEVHPKKGKWIDYCGGVKCDQCGFECDDTYYLGEANYCPNCGAKMEELA